MATDTVQPIYRYIKRVNEKEKREGESVTDSPIKACFRPAKLVVSEAKLMFMLFHFSCQSQQMATSS